MTDTDHQEESRRHQIAQQVALYGEPLSDIFGSIGSSLGLSQSEIAALLGLSAPMLSHLISGRRVKIGNPIAGARLTQLRTLAAEVSAGEVDPDDIATRLQAIASAATLGGDTVTTRLTSARAAGPREVQQLFRTVAGALDWIEVAELAADRHPEIAELLRVYGAGRADAAEAHWARVLG